MATNAIGTGNNDVGVIEVTLTTAKTLGYADLIGGKVGVYMKSGVLGDKVPFKCSGAIMALKHADTAKTWTVLQTLYYRATGTCITGDPTGHTMCGVALAAATATDTKGLVQLNWSPAVS